MARLDARVQLVLPATAYGSLATEGSVNPVTIRDLSLSGALIQGIQADSQFLKIRHNSPEWGEIELNGEIVRIENGCTAVRLINQDKSAIQFLWQHIRDNLKKLSLCPYCGAFLDHEQEDCGQCGMSLNFEHEDYLADHLRKTFPERIQGRIAKLDGDSLQRIIGFIDKELLRLGGQSFEEEFVGTSREMLEVFGMIKKVAPTDMNVLILGESGTGKELTARAIHKRSERRGKPFAPVNAAAIPEGLLESEFFGHAKGAFTGAHATSKGKFEMADGGTLFLDEIGELPQSLQAKLLRFLEDRIVERIGAIGGRRVDVRIVAATNCDLNCMIGNGNFRNDLFFRLNAFTIKLPPLKDRGEDRVILAKYFFRKICQAENSPVRGFSPAAIEAIREYSWPGNVRELINKVRRGFVMASGEYIEPSEMELIDSGGNQKRNLKDSVTENKKELVLKALEENNFCIARTARVLQVSRPSIYSMIKKLGIEIKK